MPAPAAPGAPGAPAAPAVPGAEAAAETAGAAAAEPAAAAVDAGIDPTFLAELPEELRAEVMAQQARALSLHLNHELLHLKLHCQKFLN